MSFQRRKRIAIGDGCLESSQSTTLVRFEKPIHKLPSIKTFIYSIGKQLKKALGKLSCKGRDDAVQQAILQNDMSSLQNDMNSRKGRDDAVLQALNGLQNTMKSLLGRDDAVLQALNDLQNTMRSLQNTMRSLQNTMSSLQNTSKSLLNTSNSILNTTKSLQNALNDLQNTMNSEFGTIAKQVAKELTIMLKTDDGNFFGHGILIECVDQSEFAILTAAHVAVEALVNFDRERFDLIQFHSGKSYTINKTGDAECFFARQYLMHGIRDVGIIIIRFAEGEPRPTTLTNLNIFGDDPLDTKYTGRSNGCRIRSDPFSKIRDDRVMLGHPTREGCSGTPMFSSGGEIIAVLHGESKHRRRRPVLRQEANNTNTNNRGQGRHTANNTEGIRDEISDRVYVDLLRTDGLQSFDDLVFWGGRYSGCLAHLESLEQYHAANPAVQLRKPTNRYFIDNDGNDEFANNDEDNDDSTPMIPKKVARQFHDAVIAFFVDSDNEADRAWLENHDAFLQDHFTIEEFCEALYAGGEQDRVGKDPLSRRLKFVNPYTVRAFKGDD